MISGGGMHMDLICPLCGKPLVREERSWRCENRHSFDIARQGYVNLLAVQQKHSLNPGDTRDQVDTGGQSYTNQISISTDIDGSIYNGTGYAVGKRVSTDFSIKTVANPSATNVIFLTGFIPIKNGDIIRMKNCYCEALDYDNVGIYGQRSSSINIAFYDAGKTALGKVAWSAMANPNDWLSCSPFAENIVTEFTITGTAAYMRIAAAPTADASDAILTVNELID